MVTTLDKSSTSLVVGTYGDRDEIISLSKRIKIMVPGGNQLSDAEAQALAQVSIVTHLNPFIGEIWYIPGRGPMVGIKGARRCGNEQIEDAGGRDAYWTADLSVCSPEEAGATEPAKTAAAFKCIITDSVSTMKYQKLLLETISAMRAAGTPDPVGEAKEIVGKRPQWIGFGFSIHEEKSKMNKQALAMKRAEADAMKRKFDIPFGAEVAAGDTAVETGAWIEAKADDVKAPELKLVNIDLHPVTIEQARGVLVMVDGKERLMGELDATRLNYVIENSLHMDKVEAAKVVLKEDFRMEPPQPEKLSTAEKIGQLGF